MVTACPAASPLLDDSQLPGAGVLLGPKQAGITQCGICMLAHDGFCSSTLPANQRVYHSVMLHIGKIESTVLLGRLLPSTASELTEAKGRCSFRANASPMAALPLASTIA